MTKSKKYRKYICISHLGDQKMQIRQIGFILTLVVCSCAFSTEAHSPLKIKVYDNCSSGGSIFLVTKSPWEETLKICGNDVKFTFKNNILKVKNRFTEALQNVGGSNGWKVFVGTSHIVIRQ